MILKISQSLHAENSILYYHRLDRLLQLEYDKRNRTQEEPLSVTSDDDDDDELYDNFDDELVAPRKTSGGILRRTSTRRKKSSRSRGANTSTFSKTWFISTAKFKYSQ